MDPDGPETEATQQATQKTLDPRRVGKQRFSDDEITDIICLLRPNSEAARAELLRMATRSPDHVDDKTEVAHPHLPAAHARSVIPYLVGEHAIVLRLSAHVKDPLNGFIFGRNFQKCDFYFLNDPLRRVSNVHFRIYLNEYGVLMLEDSSINGTVVDGKLLKARQEMKPGDVKLPRRRTITTGSSIQILMRDDVDDLDFIVQIPRREGEYEEAYRRNLSQYLDRLRKLREQGRHKPGKGHIDASKTITPGPNGHPDIFPVTETKEIAPQSKPQLQPPRPPTQETIGRLGRLRKEWDGSDKYNRVGRIGKGAFATVYQVTAKLDGQPYAAKELDKRKFMKNGVLDQKFENEMSIMQRIKHPSIVEYIEHINWNDRLLIIIMEFVPNGDIGSLIGENGPLREDIVRQMAGQMLSALAYLHTNNITHRDVKPDNILCQSFNPFVVKLSDFGLSKMVDTEQTCLKTFCGTLLYCAPEVYNEFTEYDDYGHRDLRNKFRRRPVGQRYDHAIDIWSLGGVLYYALTGKPPFTVQNCISYTDLLHRIMTKKLNTQPLNDMNISDDGIEFVSMMLHRRPEQRATIEELRSHSWLQGTEFFQQSNEEDIDEGLEKEASQLSLQNIKDSLKPTAAPRSDDEVEADEDDGPAQDADQWHESQKEEHYKLGRTGSRQHAPLFGEVNNSAVGSSRAIGPDRLNLPASAASFDRTKIIFQSACSTVVGPKDSAPCENLTAQPSARAAVSSALTQSRRHVSRSVDKKNCVTSNFEGQGLGGAEAQPEILKIEPPALSNGEFLLSSPNPCKRKPADVTTDELDSNPKAQPRTKKLKSEKLLGGGSISRDDEIEQCLCAQVPPLSGVNRSRQIDKPVPKSVYWDTLDRTTWHLNYPEMTQLQHDAFSSAATSRGETFGPGKTPLWDLAMKHFPPADRPTLSPSIGGNRAPDLDTHRAPTYPPPERMVAFLESAEGSVVSDISIPIGQAMISWGRARENTHVYAARMESKIPKYALKVMLWKDGYKPFMDFGLWNQPADDLYFYASTKATNGMQINKTVVPSNQPRDPKGPSVNWVQLRDGDTIVFWIRGDSNNREEAKLVFRCRWGASSQPRDPTATAKLVSPRVSVCLDASCRRLERGLKQRANYEMRLLEADLDAFERLRNIEKERLRSQNFEAVRHEAHRAVAMRAARKSPPALISPIALPSLALPGMMMTGGDVVGRLRSAFAGLGTRALQTTAEE